MATIHHQSYHHHSSPSTRSRRLRRHSLDSSLPSSTTSSSLSLKQYSSTPISLSSHMITFSLSSTASATTTSPDTAFSLEVLQRHLASGNFRQADDETRRLLIVLAGEAAIKRGYVFFSEVQFIPKEDLKAIDKLWMKFSNNRFGYSVQKKIWLKVDKDFTKFFMKVGWMKKLDTEVEQYNYRAFPNEFMWELNINNDDEESNNNNNNNNYNNNPPEGHLPLTNALRGTQLLTCILCHPAFDDGEGGGSEKVEDDIIDDQVVDESDKKKSRFATLRERLFKPNYSY